MNINDPLGDRMKLYEGIEANKLLVPLLPILVRLDGKCFSSFTKGLKRPYDERFTKLMVGTTKFLVDKTNAVIGYTQSDEISLMLYSEDIKSETFFNGRIQKLTSVIASMCTAFFNKELKNYIEEKADALAFFDCRVWNVPNLVEASNVFVWRELDATKNSISMAAQSMFSHNQLMNKNCSQMQDMMMLEKEVNWNNYPSFFKRGTYIRRVKKEIAFTTEEIDKLPPKHEARTNPNLKIERSVVEEIELPPILRIENRVDVLFNGKDPIERMEK